MAVEEFIKRMPKVDLNIQLEGAFNVETLVMIAEQNNVRSESKKFDHWVDLLKNPDYSRLDEIARTAGGWVRFPEDVAHVVYDLGVALSRQQVRYAEVTVLPSIYTDNGMSFEVFAEALADGANRAERAWNVKLAWILAIPRDRPRKGDDIARWATSAAARKANVVALGLVGDENPQPIGQFKRAFTTAEKKLMDRVVQANFKKVDEASEILETLHPTRVLDAPDIIKHADVITHMIENGIPYVGNMTRDLRSEKFENYTDYPLQKLYDENISVMLGSGLPTLYQSTLTDEYLAAAEHFEFGLDEIQEIALNSINHSFLPDEDKATMLAEFLEAYGELQAELFPEESQEEATE